MADGPLVSVIKSRRSYIYTLPLDLMADLTKDSACVVLPGTSVTHRSARGGADLEGCVTEDLFCI